jgi:alkylation response protein AidB-like acyl-CoA dehydrogenase
MTTMIATSTPILELPQDLLERCRQRAGEADRLNEYFTEDLAELRAIGYLTAPVPEHHGGWGLDLAQIARQQRSLAAHAPATALATTMHFYWVGLARELERFGDDSCTWILQEAAAGKIFAAGHAERGNDVPVLMSTATAERVDGGYRFTGHKMFGSNGPTWNYLGAHGLHVDADGGMHIVHGFVERDAPGVQVIPTWDTLGMRPTQSHDTILDGVFVPDDRIGRITPAGSEQDLFLLSMNIWALPLIASVYLGIADRAMELAVASATTKTSVAIPGGTYATNPFVQHQLAQMYLELDAASATVERLIEDWLAGADLGATIGARIMSAKWRAVETAKHVVDLALEVTGGAGMFKGNELERLYRDVRCGGFHPGNDALTHEVVAKAVLGMHGEGPRW